MQSPFLLGGTIKHHLDQFRERYPQIVKEIQQSLYVDDLINGVTNANEGKQFKDKAIQIFSQAGFTLHKWHSNVPLLEENQESTGELTYARETFGSDGRQTKLLGLLWDKAEDTLSVTMPEDKAVVVK